MYYSYVEIEYVATSFSPARTDLALKLLRAIYLVLKTASRDAGEVIEVSSYIFLGFHQVGQCDCLENLLFPSLALVGVLTPRKDDGTDLGCIWIQSNGLIALEIKCCCMRLVNSCSTVLVFGSL
jgi:hypothetical protein